MTRPRSDPERLIQTIFAAREQPRDHICGACRTPYGRSALPCKNDPDRRAR